MKKNELVQTVIEDMTTNGEGIGHADGYTLFVLHAVVGDTVLARITRPKKTYAFARVEKLLLPSASRTEARCPAFPACGGCRLQAMEYTAQLASKARMVKSDLIRIGKIPEPEMLAPVGMKPPFRYRNKAQYPIGTDRDGRHVGGYYAARTHTIVPVKDCLLTPEVQAEILRTYLHFLDQYGISAYDERTGKGLARHLLIREGFSTGEILVCPVINGTRLPHAEALVEALRRIPGVVSICLNVNTKRSNVILGTRVIPLFGKPYITDTLTLNFAEADVSVHETDMTEDAETVSAKGACRKKEQALSFRISPLSFYQVNPVQAEKLYARAITAAALTGMETVFDLYCGIGTISLFLAQRAKVVYGIEIVPDAVRDAKENAERNGITNAHFFAGAAEEMVQAGKFPDGMPIPRADVVVVDPPRKGCAESLIRTILKMRPARVVYVSCDPATLARDVQLLCGEGTYELAYAQPYDLFPQTCSVETAALLIRKG